MKDNWYWDKDLEMYRHMYDKPDPEEGVPFLFWDEGQATREYRDKEKLHHPTDTTLVPYYESESGEDLYPGFKTRHYEYKDGGLVRVGLTLLKSRDNPHAGVETLFKRK